MDDTVPAAPAKRSRLAWVFVGDDGLRAGWSLILFILFVIALSFGLVWLLHALHPGKLGLGAGMKPGTAILQEALSLLVVGLAALIMSLIERRRFWRYNLQSPSVLADFGKGLAAGLAMLSVLIGLLLLTGGIAFHGLAIGGGAIVTFGIEWLVAFLLVGLFEEFAFRGYLQFTLARGVAGIARWLGRDTPKAPTIGFWVAGVVLSIVLFAVAHTSNGGETAMGIIAVSLAGFVFLFSLWWTGSLWWAIGFHTAWDWAQSYLYGVADSGLVSEGHLLASEPTGTALISGGTTGPEGSVLVVPVLLVTLAVIWRTMPRRRPPILDGEA
ncbi:MAG TPA: CPBP family intramembrane glutamic endopeptidase [Sphingomonas sp.]|nr:CPBP family intramembrane glutamic endopeptidase [Sphingomonas sp.]